jgi:hypothetical protein
MTMAPALIVHIAAGSLAILSGAAAVSVAKGERLHRVFGTVFFLAMLTMSALGVYLALFVPAPPGTVTPPSASVCVGLLTFYLAVTGWMTVRRKDGSIGLFEKGAFFAALSIAAALLILGVRAAMKRHAGDLIAPYFVFASFAAFAAALDLKVVLSGGIAGAARIARHLWRMCFALFFASAFFFIGQQKVMPVAMHRSPLLFILAFAPLLLMVFWLVRVRVVKRFAYAGTGVATPE